MGKIEVLDVLEVDGIYYTIEKPKGKRFKSIYPTLTGSLAVSLPTYVYAADGEDTFHRIWDAVMTGLDFGVVLVIVFAGVSWMLGHRSKSIEILIGCCCGYILARHAVDIRDMLKTI